jgi:hypothetical protein
LKCIDLTDPKRDRRVCGETLIELTFLVADRGGEYGKYDSEMLLMRAASTILADKWINIFSGYVLNNYRRMFGHRALSVEVSE